MYIKSIVTPPLAGQTVKFEIEQHEKLMNNSGCGLSVVVFFNVFISFCVTFQCFTICLTATIDLQSIIGNEHGLKKMKQWNKYERSFVRLRRLWFQSAAALQLVSPEELKEHWQVVEKSFTASLSVWKILVGKRKLCSLSVQTLPFLILLPVRPTSLQCSEGAIPPRSYSFMWIVKIHTDTVHHQVVHLHTEWFFFFNLT